MPPSLRDFFVPKGILSQAVDNFEFRAGQLEMAEAVAEALRENRHAVVEAGTGTGKTMAYLIPALLSGKRVVVSTGTKNLQEQLFFKDIPILERALGRRLAVTYMKGRANYLCRAKLEEAAKAQTAWLDGIGEVNDFRIIQDWAKSTEIGDRSELRNLPESSAVWGKLDARRERCTGQKCNYFDTCHITAMLRRAAEADIIIVNHHLFFADLAVKQEDFGGIIPSYNAVVFDEAHEIEDIAGQYFGLSISNLQVQDLIRDIRDLSRRKGETSGTLEQLLTSVLSASDRFFSLFGELEGRSAFRVHDEFLEQYGEQYAEVVNGLRIVATQLQLLEGAIEEVAPLHRRAEELSEGLKAFFEKPSATNVYWTERRGRAMSLQAIPIDVSALLSEKLFEGVPSVILTSATLTTAGNFDFLHRRLGIESARCLSVDSPFQFEKQAMLYVPQTLPDPRQSAWAASATQEIVRLLHITEGRAFCLFTSYQQMRQIYERVGMEVEYPLLLQGTKPRNVLLEEFKATPNAVLFATSSFWQGVDVQGDQLSMVIIDKLPFAVPTDPVVEARSRAIEEAGGQPFTQYQVPQAALALKQGFGRLIRSKRDRGILALLDVRITKSKYGQIFFDSLPNYSFTTDILEVEEFFHVRSNG
ncbi:MAG: ATP-dependent DNA helicase [Bryobacter sp.]